MEVTPASVEDLDAVMGLLSEARRWHRERGVDMWQAFDPVQIGKDVRAGRVFVAKAGGVVCGTVTLVDRDAHVWGKDERGDALYIHKLASSRASAGTGIGARLIDWARGEARRRGRKWLRLDTWNGNRKMRDYYENRGFRHVRDEFFAPDSPLPADYRGTYKSLYQLEA